MIKRRREWATLRLMYLINSFKWFMFTIFRFAENKIDVSATTFFLFFCIRRSSWQSSEDVNSFTHLGQNLKAIEFNFNNAQEYSMLFRWQSDLLATNKPQYRVRGQWHLSNGNDTGPMLLVHLPAQIYPTSLWTDPLTFQSSLGFH